MQNAFFTINSPVIRIRFTKSVDSLPMFLELFTKIADQLPTGRRQWLKRSLLGSGLAVGGYATLLERRLVKVENYSVPLQPQFKHLDGLKIAILSDFHFDDFGDESLVRTAVEKTNELAPDIILLPGDFTTDDWTRVEPLAEILADLRASHGIFATLGNHDFDSGPKKVTTELEKHGIRVLRNDLIEYNDFAIAGFESVSRLRPQPQILSKTDLPVILGWHEPDAFDLVKNQPNLVLQASGHTHGGQIRIPGLSPLFLPTHGSKYVEGLFEREKSHLVVTRGIGALGIPVRFACPPEIGLATLKA